MAIGRRFPQATVASTATGGITDQAAFSPLASSATYFLNQTV